MRLIKQNVKQSRIASVFLADSGSGVLEDSKYIESPGPPDLIKDLSITFSP